MNHFCGLWKMIFATGEPDEWGCRGAGFGEEVVATDETREEPTKEPLKVSACDDL